MQDQEADFSGPETIFQSCMKAAGFPYLMES